MPAPTTGHAGAIAANVGARLRVIAAALPPGDDAATLAEAVTRITAADAGLDRLASEIRHAAAAIANGIAMRTDHPSYGYTKTGLTAELHQLEGMIAGHMMAAGAYTRPAKPVTAITEHAAATFGLDLPGLRAAIRASGPR